MPVAAAWLGWWERTPRSWFRLEVLLSRLRLLAITGGGDRLWLPLLVFTVWSSLRARPRAEYGSWTVFSLQTRLSSTSWTAGWANTDIWPAAVWLWAVRRIIRAAWRAVVS